MRCGKEGPKCEVPEGCPPRVHTKSVVTKKDHPRGSTMGVKQKGVPSGEIPREPKKVVPKGALQGGREGGSARGVHKECPGGGPAERIGQRGPTGVIRGSKGGDHQGDPGGKVQWEVPLAGPLGGPQAGSPRGSKRGLTKGASRGVRHRLSPRRGLPGVSKRGSQGWGPQVRFPKGGPTGVSSRGGPPG